MNREQKRDALELIILSLLSEGPLYGYAIIKRVAGQSRGEIQLTPGVLYPLLHNLESQKLIAARWEHVKSDRRDPGDETEGRKRKWYRITERGRRRLAHRVKAHRAYQAMINSFIPDRAARTEGGGA